MPSITVENYLKQLYLEQQEAPEYLVAMGSLAEAMAVTPGTATAMIKTLAASGLVEYEPRVGVQLTPAGKQLALHVLRRHRILELFLVEVLGLDWSEVHEEAEHLEHSISEKVLEKMDAFLGYPSFDPHGDPIPSAKGKIQRKRLDLLTNCEEGDAVQIARVTDQNPEFLQFADRYSLKPGTPVTIENLDPVGESVTVRAEGQDAITLGTQAAAKILVEPG